MTPATDRVLLVRVTKLENASEYLAKARRLTADAERHMAHEQDTYHWLLAQGFEDIDSALRCGRNHLEAAREVRG